MILIINKVKIESENEDDIRLMALLLSDYAEIQTTSKQWVVDECIRLELKYFLL